MAKISPVSIKYMIHISFVAEGALEKPDVIGALFGQTEGLLGADLEMRELQKEGKIGRIEVELERQNKRTMGTIKIPTALDKSETTLVAAAIETIERIGPCDSTIEVEKIEDVRGSKRDYIIERAKKLMLNIGGSTDSREISNEIKDSARTASVQEYGPEKLSCGDLSGKEIIVVEGRADVMNLLRNGVNNVIGMNGTKLPDSIKELGKEKEITLFVDGDRGGKLIAQNVVDNAKVKYIATAPDGKEVEELTGKEILANLRKKVEAKDFFSSFFKSSGKKPNYESKKPIQKEIKKLDEESKTKLREFAKSHEEKERAIIVDENIEKIKNVSVKSLNSSLRHIDKTPLALIVYGTITPAVMKLAEEAGCSAVIAKNFSTTDTNLELMSL